MGALHQLRERLVRKRIDEVNARMAGQNAGSRFANVGIQMNRVDDLDIEVAIGDGTNCQEDLFERFALIFTAVSGDEDGLESILAVETELREQGLGSRRR